MSNIKKLALTSAGVFTTIGVMTLGLVAHAADYTASTTAAINDAGASILGMFFTNLPVILTFVVAIAVTMWGIRWVLSHFRGGKR